MVSAIEGLTPDSPDIGRDNFYHVTADQIEDTPRDRAFAIRMLGPPVHVGQVVNGSSWRFLTQAEILIKYLHSGNVENDEDRIAEDVTQIAKTLLQKGNHHSDFEGIAPSGDGLYSTSVDEDEERNYLASIALSIHHL